MILIELQNLRTAPVNERQVPVEERESHTHQDLDQNTGESLVPRLARFVEVKVLVVEPTQIESIHKCSD